MSKVKTIVMMTSLVFFLSVGIVKADTTQTPNGYIDTNNKVIPKPSQGYTPPNVQESKAREAKKNKADADRKKEAEKSIENSASYQKAKEASLRVDKTLSNKKPSVADMAQASKDIALIKAFISDSRNKQYESSNQFASLNQTVITYDENFLKVTEEAETREEYDNYIENAKTTNDPSKMAKLTSYLFVEEGFFSTKDVFPKTVNGLVQALFFMVKMTYILVMIILEQIFSQNAYQQLDSVVATSASFFNQVMLDYRYPIFVLALSSGLLELIRKKRFPFSIFKFVLVWFVALFLYSKSSLPDSYGNTDIKATYNISRVIKYVDGLGAEFTKSAITSFDTLEGSPSKVGDSNEESLKAVRNDIFQQMVYEPFIALNFNQTSDKIKENKVKELLRTGGAIKEVESYHKANKKISRLSFGDIGTKFIVSLAALIRGFVLGVALIGLGLISLVFKYLAMILLLCLVLILIMAMLPSGEHLLSSVFKKLLQFAFIGGLGLFFIRIFLYINSLIGTVSTAMSGTFIWSSIIQGLIWFIIWFFRGALAGVFVKGSLSAQEVARRTQQSLDRVSLSPLGAKSNPLSQSRSLNKEKGMSEPSSEQARPRHFERDSERPSRFSTLRRATGGAFKEINHHLAKDLGNIRYGEDDDKRQKGEEKREHFKTLLQDKKDDVAYHLSKPSAYGLRSKIHDLAGDENTPSQVRHQERQKALFERQERRQERQERRQERKKAPLKSSPFREVPNEEASPFITDSRDSLEKESLFTKRKKHEE